MLNQKLFFALVLLSHSLQSTPQLTEDNAVEEIVVTDDEIFLGDEAETSYVNDSEEAVVSDELAPLVVPVAPPVAAVPVEIVTPVPSVPPSGAAPISPVVPPVAPVALVAPSSIEPAVVAAQPVVASEVPVKSVPVVAGEQVAQAPVIFRTPIASSAASLDGALKAAKEKEIAGLKMPEETPDEKASRLKRFQQHIQQAMTAKMAQAKVVGANNSLGSASGQQKNPIVKTPVSRAGGRKLIVQNKKPVVRKKK